MVGTFERFEGFRGDFGRVYTWHVAEGSDIVGFVQRWDTEPKKMTKR